MRFITGLLMIQFVIQVIVKYPLSKCKFTKNDKKNGSEERERETEQ